MNNMQLKSKQDAEEFVFWCVTLQCEVLPQGAMALQTNIGFCCLGIGVLCTVPDDRIERFSTKDLMIGCTPSAQPTPEWLQNINENAHQKSNGKFSPIMANDTDGKSHKEIGTLLLELYKDEVLYWGV